MNDDLKQAVETGTVTEEIATRLESLEPGTYCRHKSWGFGQVAEWSLPTGQVLIDFESKKNHAMEIEYALESLEIFPPEHINARVRSDAEAVKAQAKEDPVSLVRQILGDLGGSATLEKIQGTLVPVLYKQPAFKKWWDAAKKKLKSDGHFQLPAKKTEKVVLLEAPVAAHTGLLTKFRAARHLKDQVAALDQLMKDVSDFSDEPEELEKLVRQIEDVATKGQRLDSSRALELLLARDVICERYKEISVGEGAPVIADILRDEQNGLPELFSELPASKHRQVLESFEEAFGERWSVKAISLMQKSQSRLVADVHKLFQKKNQAGEFKAALERSIADRSISSEVLIWFCKERGGPFPELFTADIFSAVLSALEMDQLSERKTSRLRDLLLDDKNLIADFFAKADREAVRDSMRRLLMTTVFDDLSRRSMLGRIIKLHPEIQSMVSGDSVEEEDRSLTVSWASLERRKLELDELINKKIPQNVRDIQIARDYGDLRENFEFKSAKEQQAVLARQKLELESMLANARGTNFENAETSAVSIGSVVTLSNLADGSTETFSVLGAWDSAPEHGVISYKTAIGQALMGKAVGDELEVSKDDIAHRVRIDKIERFTNLDLLQKTGAPTAS
ncbi:MAG: GreA/GreB family elongation factor [Chthoniobacterales bacterium]